MAAAAARRSHGKRPGRDSRHGLPSSPVRRARFINGAALVIDGGADCGMTEARGSWSEAERVREHRDRRRRPRAIAAGLGSIVGASNVEIRPGGPRALSHGRPRSASPAYRGLSLDRAASRRSRASWPGRTSAASRSCPAARETSLAAGAVPIHGGIVLALTRMNRIMSIDPVDPGRGSVQPGVTTQDLARAVAEHGPALPTRSRQSAGYPRSAGKRRHQRRWPATGSSTANTGGYVPGCTGPSSLTARSSARAAGCSRTSPGTTSSALLTGFGGHLGGTDRDDAGPAPGASGEHHRNWRTSPTWESASDARTWCYQRRRPARHPRVPRLDMHPRRRRVRTSGAWIRQLERCCCSATTAATPRCSGPYRRWPR